MSKNKFGGGWTEAKMEIVVRYARAYLAIMSKQSWAKTMYFDGFAGSGIIEARMMKLQKERRYEFWRLINLQPLMCTILLN